MENPEETHLHKLLMKEVRENDEEVALLVSNKPHYYCPDVGYQARKLEVWDEAKKQVWLGWPLIITGLLQYSIQVISTMFAGHLGELSLSTASVATSFGSVTGPCVLAGMSGALETLCGQSYGAKQYKMLGIYTQRGMMVLLATSIPLAITWYYTSEILIVCGQDQEISMGAGAFNRWMIPTLFAYSILQCLNKFLMTQNIVFPLFISSGITAILHVLVCWVLIFKVELGIKGAAMANNISYFFNVLLLGIYVKVSPACTKTWTGFSLEALSDACSFLRLAIPSASMMCLEYWAFEMVVLISGLLPNAKLETSVLSISLNTCWMVYEISYGLSAALSTRVSNELGAGYPKRAQVAIKVMVMVSVSVGLVVAAVSMLVRNVWGKLYSNEAEVINYVAQMMLPLAISNLINGFQCVLSGAARGCGWQKLCTYINLGAYYLVAIPCAVVLAFFCHFGGMGLWMGLICGISLQLIAIVTVILLTDWKDVAKTALERVQS